MKIYYSPKFVKSYKRVPTKIQLLAEKKEAIFRVNPHDQRLKTHVLDGELNGRWSFSVNFQYRIIFRFEDSDDILFLIIGTHDIYK